MEVERFDPSPAAVLDPNAITGHADTSAQLATDATHPLSGYGTDPDLLRVYRPGELWPLTFSEIQRQTAAVLCELIVPADDESPGASAVGVVGFIDEWISAPYPLQRADRTVILHGLDWLEFESARRFGRGFVVIEDSERVSICDDICYLPRTRPELVIGAKFFARYRDLTAAGFYTTAVGRRDLRYMGNIPLAAFDGPPPQVLQHVGLI